MDTTVPPAVRAPAREYALENVFLRTTRAIRSEIVSLWREEGAIGEGSEARRRSHEAVLLVRRASGELAGLSTVGLVKVEDGRTFYAYRMFLRVRDRVPYLMLAVVLATRDFLQTFAHPKERPAGMLHVNENRKLMRPGMRRLFERVGYRYWGQTPNAEDVWVFEFGQVSCGASRVSGWGLALKKLKRLFSRRLRGHPVITVISTEPETAATQAVSMQFQTTDGHG